MSTSSIESQALYPWSQSLWQRLNQALSSDRLPNSIMIESDAGLGESQIVNKLAQAILCSTSSDEGCGFCHSCQLFAAGTHPDLHRLSPLEGKKTVAVEQVRELNRFATESSQLSGKRVLVVDLAEQLNESSSNALLKTLEEPPAQCHFILITHHKAQLLPTIVSRCQQWQALNPDLATTRQWISQNNLQASELALALYAHVPLKIERFDSEHASALQTVIDELSRQSPLEAHSSLIKLLKESPLERLEQLSAILHMSLRHQLVPYAGLENVLDSIAQRWSYNDLHQMVLSLDELREQLRSHPGLNFDLLLLEWLSKL